MEKLTRTAYRDPATDAERDGSTARRESLLDHEQYERPLERAHGAALHTPGVATGLEVRATAGSEGVQVLPGVALTARGDHVVLAENGRATVAGSLVPVTSEGVLLPTAGLDDVLVLTIGHAETFDRRTFDDSQGRTFRTEHTPALALRPAGQPPDRAAEVVLATVTVAAGLVTAMEAGSRVACTARRAVHRSELGPGLSVGAAVVGELRAEADGLALTTGDSALALTTRGASLIGPGDGANLWLSERSATLGGGSLGVSLSLNLMTGNVRIDTADAQGRLDVTGDAGVAGSLTAGGITTAGTVAATSINAQNGITAGAISAGAITSSGAVTAGRLTVSGNVGVGTAEPKARLHVTGGAIMPAVGAGGNAGITFPTLGSNDTAFIRYSDVTGDERKLVIGIGNDASDRIVFQQAGASRMTIRGNRVGIGTEQPSGQLHVQAGTEGGTALVVDGAVLLRRPEPGFAVSVTGRLHVAAEAVGNLPTARFVGEVHVNGTLTKRAGQFRIDHPLDPQRRYLSHSFVESDEMKNVYDGVAELDANGAAEIVVPEWFEALNERFRYQLTPVGRPAPQLHVASRLRDRRFTIAGGVPRTEVCWQVTGVRHDAYALAHPLVVESDKAAGDDDPIELEATSWSR
jgi:hypothetical protein